ncbi:MAG: PAS domain-containing protein [Myxococcota bacterium]|nr:PAS domain-containing protein [Myxococcota bacterium]
MSTTATPDSHDPGPKLRQRILDFDWAHSPLGPRAAWPPTLQAAVNIALGSRFGMGILWGRDRVQLYNDAYVPMLAQKHPASLGQRARDCWTDIWDQIDPMFTAVEQTGEANFLTDQLMLINKRGRPEECYFTFSYSPIFGDGGKVDGIFVTALETTPGVLAERRQHTLQQMAQVVTEGLSPAEALARCAAPLAENPSDVPFSVIYVVEPDSRSVRRVFQQCPGQPALGAPETLSLDPANASPWAQSLRQVLAQRRPLHQRVEGIDRELLWLPLCVPGEKSPCAVLGVGISPLLPWESDYQFFLHRVGESLLAALTRVAAVTRLVQERIEVLERMTDGFFATDRDWRVTYVNAATERYMQLPREQLVGRRIWDVVPALEGGDIHQRYARAMLTQEADEFESAATIRGQLARISVYPAAEGISVFFRDLSTLREAERRVNVAAARLKEAHRLTAALVHSAPVAIVACDPELLVTSWNPAAERLFGWDAAAVVGRPLPILPKDEEEEEEARQRIRREFQTGIPVDRVEVRRRHRDGTQLYVLLSSALLYDDLGQVNGRVAFMVDLSERRKLEEQLLHAQKMDAIGQLAGGIAHDFNNLLAVILANVRICGAALAPDSEERQCALDAQNAGERAAVLTRQLLTFSRRQTVDTQPLQVDAAVRAAERMLRPLIRADIQLVTRLDSGTHFILADPGQFEQVLVNLVVNARDAMPKGGQLTLATSLLDLPELIGSLRPGRYVQLEVSDTGTGMDESIRRRVFEPFFTTKPQGQGTGLGLATAYGIVNQWGGSIRVRSTVGVGTTFTLLFPVEEQARALASPAAAAAPSPGGKETLLVVEDERLVRVAVRRQLERAGYRVLEAANGVEALRLFEERGEEIALVLSDLMMPYLGGRELAARLEQRWPGVRLLFMSGYDREGAESGIQGLLEVDLRKPFAPAQLLEAVRRRLDGPGHQPREREPA